MYSRSSRIEYAAVSTACQGAILLIFKTKRTPMEAAANLYMASRTKAYQLNATNRAARLPALVMISSQVREHTGSATLQHAPL